MATVDVDDGILQADSQPKSVGSVWRFWIEHYIWIFFLISGMYH